jgi:hypothetical protein
VLHFARRRVVLVLEAARLPSAVMFLEIARRRPALGVVEIA